MKFRVILKDPFGTISGGGEIVMDAGSVFEAGVAHAMHLEGDTMVVTSEPLTEEERAEQVRQITEGLYVQRARMPWAIELSET